MLFKTTALATLLAVAQARFNQEQIPIPAIAAVQGGAPGVAQTIAGAAVSDLLAASNACDKLKRGDQIIAELGTGADAVAAAIGIVAAEKNFNPFVQSIPTICDDPTLPATDVLRGITPLIDPAVVGSDIANALSAKTKVTPLDATGKSVADLLAENGFTNFTGQSAAGATSAAPAASGSASTDTSSTTAVAATSVANACGTLVTSVVTSATTSAAVETTTAAAATAGNATETSTVSGADFGLCVPTMKFEGGLDGRPATEFTFLPIDPLCAQGQQEALNPNIITNRICDQLTNVCEANDAAKTLCRSVQAQIQALGTRDKSTADTWNTNLGFAGAITNPDGGPAEPPAKMRVVRSYKDY
ncbi:uncharacterized protein Z520_09319 [Fonsecaea multimorphosa CBS 102226]|uniref:Uncharacterized protein n=1 Tax=Fonsecaea multimorphosa CBS 102226 TaxID=1442371 RepID=A0A0D2JWY1_9EURO|nr:uncharacterized protein Z520_09319 [Fonsecaea multimorphosa CBS 102226]KIX95009.1 hypothetical protein Z520_09319 [Fonsecaea multimorphosa CBS 102226]OAL20657.1 hypothetical protein AYO22_08666 [Fonsecaea multimorphosa]